MQLQPNVINREILLEAYWAHNTSKMFEGFLSGYDSSRRSEQDYELVNGLGIWPGLVQIDNGSFQCVSLFAKYNIIGFNVDVGNVGCV